MASTNDIRASDVRTGGGSDLFHFLLSQYLIRNVASIAVFLRSGTGD
jgi:hypothetical protein